MGRRTVGTAYRARHCRKHQFSIVANDMTLGEFAGIDSGPYVNVPLRAITGGPIMLQDLPAGVRRQIFREVTCLRCHYSGLISCSSILVDDCRTYLFGVSSALEILERLLKMKVDGGIWTPRDGSLVDVRDLQNDVAVFVVRVKDQRNFLYARCCNAFNRETWSGFLGEGENEVFRGVPLDEEDLEWQNKSDHKSQFSVIGSVLSRWDELLLPIFGALDD